MMVHLLRMVAPPVFVDDEDKTRTAGMLNAILLVMLAVAAGTTLVLSLVFRIPALLLFLQLLLVATLTVLWLLLRRGLIHLVNALLVPCLWACFSAAVGASGLAAPGLASFYALVLIAGMLLGKRGAAAAAGLSVLSSLIVLWGELDGRIPNAGAATPPAQIWVVFVMNALGFVGLVHLANRSFADSLRYARREIVERRRAEERVRHLNHVLRAIRDIGQLIAREQSQAQLLTQACNILVQTRDYRMAWIGQVDPSSQRVQPIARAGYGTDYVDGLTITLDESETGSGLTATALRMRRPDVCEDIATDPGFAPWRAAALARGFASSAAVPLIRGDRVSGVLCVYAERPYVFDEEELGLLGELAGDLVFGLQTIEQQAKRKRAEAALSESEERFRHLSEAALEGLAIIDDDRIDDVNSRLAQMMGGTTWDMIGTPVADYFAAESAEKVLEHLHAATTGPAEYVARRRDGSTFPVEAQVNALPYQGKRLHVLAIRDVTLRKQAEEKSRESEGRFRSIVESTPMGIHLYRLEPDGRLVLMDANRASSYILGVDNSRLIGRTLEEAFPWLAETELPEYYRQICAGGPPWHTEHIDYEDGQMQSAFEVHAFQTGPGAMAAMFFDVTARRGAEEKLRWRAEAEAIWNSIGKTVIATTDLDEIFVTVIQTIRERMQVETGSIWLLEPATQELVIATTLQGDLDRFSAYRLRPGEGIAGAVVQTGEPALVTNPSEDPRLIRGLARPMGLIPDSILCVPLIIKDSTIGAIELLNKHGGPFTPDDQRLLESIAAPVAIAIQNARLHQQVQEQFEELAALFRTVERAKTEWELTIDAIDEGIALVDTNCRILRANRTLANWLHVTPAELVGQLCHQVLHGTDAPPPHCPHAQISTGAGQPTEVELKEPHLGGTFRFRVFPLCDPSGKTIGTVSVVKDITAEKRLQTQMIQSEKLAAMGRLAASLAHEIKNPLQVIEGCLSLTQIHADNAEKQQEYLAMAQDEFKRLTTLVQHTLDFVRPTSGTPALVDLRAVLNEMLALAAKRLQQEQVTVQIEWQDAIPRVMAVSSQLKQVFLNLVLNAVEAMPKGGVIQIRGETCAGENGPWLAVAIRDFGAGMAPEQLEKAFEPFYTTKPNGTGLGLAVCRHIIDNHHGRITVESAAGQGSTFVVWLPLHASPLENRSFTAEGA